ncbi:MAG: hypothetical protein J6P72_03705 [Firmicutes bacterium]|nr:hypothetical protein [Bacillota bacterium]
MNPIYLAKRVLNMDFKAMAGKIDGIHKKTGKNPVLILADMANCAVRYGAGYMDYDLFEMYDLTPEQRDTYITRGRSNELVKKYNDRSYSHTFDYKDEFDAKFSKYLHRDWAPITETGTEDKARALKVIEAHDIVFAKPVDGSCGKGVERLVKADFDSAEALYNYVKAYGKRYVLEEEIRQHPKVSSIYPGSINTVRIVTILKDDVAHVICAYFRIGNSGNAVDNFNHGGMVTPVDEETGIVKYPAMDKTKVVYEDHPVTGTHIQGFQFPDWDKARALVQHAAHEIPQMGYIGWDVAFSENGPLLVEGNDFTGHDLYQLKPHTPDKIGIYQKFQV